ncbi:hypothetical protein BJY16_004396 [Actinoplanes octamycinicus]|uniref:Uncharacterized protein n=1 Tax=Actinoplanes octamycinicus TaxID=135948 RepID=A0A7W7GZ72_9ACTN|nr:hypothetical protein [Actinoplanes octamycinicus]MBB4740937.1 hypothetical protein [Actinoplanes octamycinicus]GIE55844.1 hypothetical protein Aoc01nite_12460 [Actinoplanes octamycinicus]
MTVRGMIEMVLSVLGGGVLAALTLAFWPCRRGGPAGPVTGPGPLSTVLLPAAVVAAPPPVPRAESTEGLLVVQLLRDELSPAHYRTAMASLAAREEARNPMRLPGEIGPAAD